MEMCVCVHANIIPSSFVTPFFRYLVSSLILCLSCLSSTHEDTHHTITTERLPFPVHHTTTVECLPFPVHHTTTVECLPFPVHHTVTIERLPFPVHHMSTFPSAPHVYLSQCTTSTFPSSLLFKEEMNFSCSS